MKTCIIQYYEQNERNTIAWKKLIKEFSNRIIKEVESLTTDEIWHKVGVETSRWMKLPKNSGAYFLQEIYLSILEKEKGNRISLAAEHPGWETERTERTFSEKKAKEFRKLPASITKARRRGPGMCLDACYHRLASLYFQKDIEAVEETKRISDILTVRKLILKLEGKYPQGVPQKIIINTLKENFQMNVETTKATLQTMAKMDRKMLKWVR